MNTQNVVVGYHYLYHKPGQLYCLLVKALTVDESYDMVLVVNVSTHRTMRVNAINLAPCTAKSKQRAPASA